MRESRLSGSVEGVMSDHDSYSDCSSLCTSDCIGRHGAMRTEVSEAHNWTNVSPILWYRSASPADLLIATRLRTVIGLSIAVCRSSAECRHLEWEVGFQAAACCAIG